LIEVVANVHNDLWMMLPALISLGLLLRARKLSSWLRWGGIALSALSLAASISIKLATVALVPVWIGFVLLTFFDKNILTICKKFWNGCDRSMLSLSLFALAAIALFTPLLTPRSKQFLPWYLLWSLSFVPLLWQSFQHRWLDIARRTLIATLLAFCLSGLLRYVPVLYHNASSPEIISQQISITWSLPLAVGLVTLVWQLYNEVRT
jgi:hypothetical protein